jgi:hypothetical protein
VAGQIRPYPSKKAATESPPSQFSLQQPMADLVKCLGDISTYCVHLHAILHAVQYIYIFTFYLHSHDSIGVTPKKSKYKSYEIINNILNFFITFLADLKLFIGEKVIFDN